MKIVFMGTPEFSTTILKGLIKEYDVCLVVTQPDKRVGRKQILTPTPVKIVAKEFGIDIFQPIKIKQDYQKIIDCEPDMIITAAYGQMIPEAIINYPKYGCINVHGSLLPKFRGGSPMHRAITTGETETGITIMHMVKKMDAGDIITQSSFPILNTDNVGTIHDKLRECGISLLLRTIPLIISDDYTRIKQDENLVTYAKNITKEEQIVDFNKSVKEVFNHIRGFYPWPGAYTMMDGLKLKLSSSVICDSIDYQEYITRKNGKVVKIDKTGIYVKVSDGILMIPEIQLQGKRKMSVSDFMNGKGKELIKTGKIFLCMI